MADQLHTLLFNGGSARGQYVQLEQSWQRVLENHPYPPAVARMLGELVAASVLLSASLKFTGSVVLQIQGDGPVRLVIAECHHNLGIRATVKLRENAHCADDAGFTDLVNQGGKGLFALILDQKERPVGQAPYQGIVPLEGNSVSECLTQYMERSEQLPSRLWLDSNDKNAGGLLLQRMPNDGGYAQSNAQDSDTAWQELCILGDTLRPNELLNTAPEQLLHQLFWEQTHEHLGVRTPQFQCSCSRDKVSRMLQTLGKEEINESLSDNGKVSVSCDYCNQNYTFDSIDCAALFVGSTEHIPYSDGGNTLH
jgi:molecular chaperone Hsp33